MTVSSDFPTMSVTYLVNYPAKSKGYTKAANIRSFNRNQKKNNVETILIPYYRLRTENKCKCGSSNRNNKKIMWTLSKFLQQTTVHFELYDSFMFLT